MDEEQALDYVKNLGLSPVSIRQMEKATHIFTHIEWHMTGYAVECLAPEGELSWKTSLDIREHHAIPTAFRAFSKKI